MKLVKNILPIALLTLIPTFIIWAFFYFKVPEVNNIPLPTNGMATIVANYDGPLYLVVAKSLYDNNAIKTNFQFPLPVEYYAAHFPLFPVLIRGLGVITKNFAYSMLAVTLLSSFFALYFFHKLISDYVDNANALFLTAIFAIFPARWLIVRSIGSPEPLFIAAIIASVFYFEKRKYFLAGIFGAIATLTKSPGILLFLTYLVFSIISVYLIKSANATKFPVMQNVIFLS